MEIKNYLILKEDFLIIKELFFDPNDRDIFNNANNFEEIYNNSNKENTDNRNHKRIPHFI